jgi:hypothetical protein
MRSVIGILLLASPVVAGEPVYSWQSRADDPDRVYLYLDGKQVGGWDYRLKHYRSFDGTNWGTPTDTPPATPPAKQLIDAPRQLANLLPSPLFQTPLLQSPVLPPPPIRGPLRRKAVGVLDQAIMDGTVRIINEIPGAIVDQIKRGNYTLNFQSSVTGPGQPPEVVMTPPSATQPAQTPQRRLIFPRR